MDAYSYLTEKIINSADESIPKTGNQPRRPAVPWWDKKCNVLRKITRTSYRRYKNSGSQASKIIKLYWPYLNQIHQSRLQAQSSKLRSYERLWFLSLKKPVLTTVRTFNTLQHFPRVIIRTFPMPLFVPKIDLYKSCVFGE